MTVFLLGSVEESFKVSEREFLSIVDFAYHELKLPNNVSINFEFDFIDEDSTGFMHNYECDHNEYVIVISPTVVKNWEDIVRTIFHEMAHVKQHVFKEYTSNTWKGRKINIEDFAHNDLPWERDANRLEEVLFNSFILEDVF